MAKQEDEAAACAELVSLAVQHPKAAGIDVGDASHWVCVDADGGDAAIREFPAHTPGLRQLVAWLREHAISTVMPGAPIQLFDAAKAEGAAAPAREMSSAAGD